MLFHAHQQVCRVACAARARNGWVRARSAWVRAQVYLRRALAACLHSVRAALAPVPPPRTWCFEVVRPCVWGAHSDRPWLAEPQAAWSSPGRVGPSSSAPGNAELAVLVISRGPPCWPRQLAPQCRPAVCGERSPVNQKEVLYGARGNKKRNLQWFYLLYPPAPKGGSAGFYGTPDRGYSRY